MGARRRAGPAAIAAALIGAGLMLYRPRLVPELHVGSRIAPPATAATLAAAISRTTASGPASSASGSGGGAAQAAAGGEDQDWRDALADHPFVPGGRAAPGPISADSARRDRAMREAPSAAETPMHAGGSRTPQAATGRREGRDPGALKPGAPMPGAPRMPPIRAPLARGPAAPGEADDEDEGEERTVAASPEGLRPSAAAWSRRRTRTFPLFQPPRRASRPTRSAAARRRARPLLLSRLLGRGALRPPPSDINPPDLSRLKGRKPLLLPDGRPVPSRAYDLDRIEALDPRLAGAECRRRARHWDAGLVWHDGPAHGVIEEDRWLWLWKEETLWWAVRETEHAPLLRHQGLWWGKQRGVWFALHDGELWSWRRFSDWDSEGLIRLADGVELVYSADFTKVAVITPGAGAVLYDAYSGAELGEWLEPELPHRRPRAPGGLRLPRGI
jgi:hypothetical protein